MNRAELRAEARRLFVTGECETNAEIAQKLSVKPHTIGKWRKQFDWDGDKAEIDERRRSIADMEAVSAIDRVRAKSAGVALEELNPEYVADLIKERDKYKRLIRKRGDGVLLIEKLVERIYADPPEIEVPKLPRKPRGRHNEIAVLHVSDVQWGKVTDSYDPVVADARLQDLADAVSRITKVRRESSRIDEIRVYLGGDIVEGESIFPGQAHEISYGVLEQAVKAAPASLVRMILNLMGTFNRVKVKTCRGNHGRDSKFADRRTNWDDVCYHATRAILLGSPEYPRTETKDRLTFDISEKFWFVDYVYDWGNLVVHGDQIRGGFAGFPFYGTGKKAWGWIDSIPAQWDHLYFGHFHTYTEMTLNHRLAFCNGTTESDNEYAQEQLAASGFPCQRLQFFTAERGVVSDNRVWLTSDRTPQRVKHRP